MKAIILLSGGIDSMACIQFYLDIGYDVECIFCDYGQLAAAPEMNAARGISSFFGVPFHTIKTTGIHSAKIGEICGRNALLVMQALCYVGFGTYKIVLGIHDGTSYADCSMHFVDELNRVLDCYAHGTVILEAPFIRWTKPDIIKYCQVHSLPIDKTYSCESGTTPPCGRCMSCLDRKEYLND